MLLGRFSGFMAMAVPLVIISESIAWYSSCDPSHR